jgi:hypothetical protein
MSGSGLFDEPAITECQPKVDAKAETPARARRRMTETQRAAPRRTPPAPAPAAGLVDLASLWPAELRPAIDFLQFGGADLPATAFHLAPGTFIRDPVFWLEGLRRDLAAGPGCPRNCYGSLVADVLRVHELFARGAVLESKK